MERVNKHLNWQYLIPIFFSFLLFSQLQPLIFIDFNETPAWHTTVYDPKALMLLIVTLSLEIFATIGYIILIRRQTIINKSTLIIHLGTTLAYLITIKLISKTKIVTEDNRMEVLEEMNKFPVLPFLLYTLFILGNLIFIIYFIKTMNIKNK